MKRIIGGGDCWLNESWAKEEDRRHYCGLGMKLRLRAEEESWDWFVWVSLGRLIRSFALPI